MQVEVHPTSKRQLAVHGERLTVSIAGKTVNVSALARKLNANQSNLSKFLSGKRNSSILYTRRVASAIGISVDTLLEAIDARRAEKVLSIQ